MKQESLAVLVRRRDHREQLRSIERNPMKKIDIAVLIAAVAAVSLTPAVSIAKDKTVISQQTVPRTNPNGEPVDGKYDCETTYEVERQSGKTVTKTETTRGACD
jgi:hypothetical protein